MAAQDVVVFALIYFTFFLDNVLLTVVVPLIPTWARHDDISGGAGNHTGVYLMYEGGGGGAALGAGLALGAKAAAQLAAAPGAARLVARRGAGDLLGAASALLAATALVLAAVSAVSPSLSPPHALALVGASRALHGAAAAGAGVAGLALGAALPRPATPALLGAVALGVLVGYPLGGAAAGGALSPTSPFLLLAVAFLADVALQDNFLNNEKCNKHAVPPATAPHASLPPHPPLPPRPPSPSRGDIAVSASLGAVLCATSVMAALEPTLPLWIMDTFHPQAWTLGLVFVPDSLGYLVATWCGAALQGGSGGGGGDGGGRGGGGGAIERTALGGMLLLGGAAMALPAATQVRWVMVCQCALGAGLGALDAALVPALMARGEGERGEGAGGRGERERERAGNAARLARANGAAYALGPAVGGLLSWRCGFPCALRLLAALNLLYALLLYRVLRRHPISHQVAPGIAAVVIGEASALYVDSIVSIMWRKRGPVQNVSCRNGTLQINGITSKHFNGKWDDGDRHAWAEEWGACLPGEGEGQGRESSDEEVSPSGGWQWELTSLASGGAGGGGKYVRMD